MTRRFTRRQILASGVHFGMAAGVAGLAAACRGPRGERPNLLLVTLDTTRADHLGCYGYARPTSPRLDALAAESTIYTRALAPATWTLPSHGSLFTGKFPSSHGANYDPTGSLLLSNTIPGRPALAEYRVRGLAASETTLAGILTRAGYRTGGVAGGPWLEKIFGLGNGFEWWDDEGVGSFNGRSAAALNARALPWLDTVTEPFFLFLNYFDAHGPLKPPPAFAKAFLPAPLEPGAPLSLEQTLALYDGEIRYADQHLGEVIAALRRRNLYDRTWIIVTADHGDLFGEHGLMGHGAEPHQEVLHVPFVSKPPLGDGGLGERSDWIQLVDVLPLVLERLGLPRPDGIQGGILPQLGHPLLAESKTLPTANPQGDWLALIEADWKLIWNRQGRSELYDLAQDPHETRNLIAAQPERAARLVRIIQGYVASLPRPQGNEPLRAVDEATRKALENLGYIH